MAKEGKEGSKHSQEGSENQQNQSREENQNSEQLINQNNQNNLNNSNPIENKNSGMIPNRISEYGGRVEERNEAHKDDFSSVGGIEKIDKRHDGFMSDSILMENKNFIQEDPRISVDFHNMNKNNSNQDMFMNRTQYDPNLYNRKNESYYGAYDQNKSVYNPNMSTMRFMAEIDLRCDDHLKNLKEDFLADRYCSECKVLCCDSCVIEYHNQHIHAAKTKVEEYFKKQKIELEDLKSKINSSIKHKTALAELHLTMDTHDKNISNYFLRRRTYLENLKIKIESLLSDETDLCAKMKENLQAFYKDECYRRMEKPLKEMEMLLVRLQTFLRDWDGFSRTDKARAIKNDQITQFKQEANELSETVKKAAELFKGKSSTLEKNLTEILKYFNYGEKVNQIEAIMFDIQGKVKGSFAQVNKLNFDDLILEEVNVPNVQGGNNNNNNNVELIRNSSQDFNLIPQEKNSNNNFVGGNNQNIQGNYNSNQNNNQIVDHQNRFNRLLNNNKVEGVNNNNQHYEGNSNNNNSQMSGGNILNPQNNQGNNNFNFNNPYNIKPVDYPQLGNNNFGVNNNNNNNNFQNNFQQNNNVLPYFEENKNNFDLVIGVRPKSDELVVYDPRQLGFVTIKLKKEYFQNQQGALTTFPDNCRYINLGFSLLVTGGYINKQVTNNCFLVVLCKKENLINNSEPYDCSIMPYANMVEARERHNIVNLHDRSMVLVCSGFFNQNAEISDINTGIWKQIAKLNDVRANGTIAYVNKRYVWVFGGFKINDKQQGVYQNSCEILDLNNLSQGWTLLNFDKMNIQLKLSAMGVINSEEKSILLCGGYDGAQYRKDISKVDVNDKNITNVELKIKQTLPGNYIFLHNNFVRVDDFAYNFDLQMNIVMFDPKEFSFKVKNFGQK